MHVYTGLDGGDSLQHDASTLAEENAQLKQQLEQLKQQLAHREVGGDKLCGVSSVCEGLIHGHG